MKFALAFLALAFTATQAQADFRHGRVRAGAVAEMKILQASGEYANAKQVFVYQTFMDGSQDAVGFIANIDGKKINFTITKLAKSGCGDRYEALSLENMTSAESSTFALKDMSRAFCAIARDADWINVSITTKNFTNGLESTLILQGNPEQLAVTM